MCHLCQDELYAIFAMMPFLPYINAKVKGYFGRVAVAATLIRAHRRYIKKNAKTT